MSSPFKNSLSTRSPRGSPFRRQDSPATGSPSLPFPDQGPSSPFKGSSSPTSNRNSLVANRTSQYNSTSLESTSPTRPAPNRASWIAGNDTSPTRKGSISSLRQTKTPSLHQRSSSSIGSVPQTRFNPAASPAASPLKLNSAMADPFAVIAPAQLRTMRESFEVLDRSNSGVISPADVADMLGQLGIEATPSVMERYFPPGVKEMNLAGYLSHLATPFSNGTSQSELKEALAAFDDDDSGQIDVLQLKKALLSTAPEGGDAPFTEGELDAIMQPFSGRRAFTKHRSKHNENRGPVFKYNEFLNQMYASAPGSSSQDS